MSGAKLPNSDYSTLGRSYDRFVDFFRDNLLKFAKKA